MPHGFEPRETFVKRLRHRSRYRGCKEMDVVLGPFADAHLEGFSDGELVLYESLLEEDDADLWQWLTRQQPLPERLEHTVMRELLRFCTAHSNNQ